MNTHKLPARLPVGAPGVRPTPACVAASCRCPESVGTRPGARRCAGEDEAPTRLSACKSAGGDGARAGQSPRLTGVCLPARGKCARRDTRVKCDATRCMRAANGREIAPLWPNAPSDRVPARRGDITPRPGGFGRVCAVQPFHPFITRSRGLSPVASSPLPPPDPSPQTGAPALLIAASSNREAWRVVRAR
jgi:hypothetical protein